MGLCVGWVGGSVGWVWWGGWVGGWVVPPTLSWPVEGMGSSKQQGRASSSSSSSSSPWMVYRTRKGAPAGGGMLLCVCGVGVGGWVGWVGGDPCTMDFWARERGEFERCGGGGAFQEEEACGQAGCAAVAVCVLPPCPGEWRCGVGVGVGEVGGHALTPKDEASVASAWLGKGRLRRNSSRFWASVQCPGGKGGQSHKPQRGGGNTARSGPQPGRFRTLLACHGVAAVAAHGHTGLPFFSVLRSTKGSPPTPYKCMGEAHRRWAAAKITRVDKLLHLQRQGLQLPHLQLRGALNDAEEPTLFV